MKEIWYITKNVHTSYQDVLQMSPHERVAMIELINEDFKHQSEELEKAKNQKAKMSKHRR